MQALRSRSSQPRANSGVNRTDRPLLRSTSGSVGIWPLVIVLASLASTTSAAWLICKNSVVPKRLGVVVPGKIYRSGQITPPLIEDTLRHYDIEVIIDLQLNDYSEESQQYEMACAARMGIEHHRFPLGGDGRGDVQNYADAITTLVDCVRRNRPVLVHCSAGTQRTGGIIGSYRLFFEGADPQSIIGEMQAYDWSPSEDRKLSDFVDRCWPEVAVLLVRNGTLKEMPTSIPRLTPYLGPRKYPPGE